VDRWQGAALPGAGQCLRQADGSRQFLITTAGYDTTTLAGRLYLHGKKVAADEARDDDLHFVWNELPEGTDIDDDAALATIHPGVEAGFMRMEDIVAARAQQPYEFARYFGNRWTSAPAQWLPAGSWEECKDPERVV
jgi:phage terminase large subunit-like protein